MKTDAEIVLAHFHHETVRILEQERTSKAPPPPNGWKGSESADVARNLVFNEYRKLLQQVLQDIQTRPEPQDSSAKQYFESGLLALNRIDQFRHVLENLFEAVKRGESLQHTIINYAHIGIVTPSTTPIVEDDQHASPWFSNLGAGVFIRGLLRGLRRVALAVIELVTHALKALPDVAIKPKPAVGVVGVAPSFSLAFEPEIEAVSLREMFQVFANAGNMD